MQINSPRFPIIACSPCKCYILVYFILFRLQQLRRWHRGPNCRPAPREFGESVSKYLRLYTGSNPIKNQTLVVQRIHSVAPNAKIVFGESWWLSISYQWLSIYISSLSTTTWKPSLMRLSSSLDNHTSITPLKLDLWPLSYISWIGWNHARVRFTRLIFWTLLDTDFRFWRLWRWIAFCCAGVLLRRALGYAGASKSPILATLTYLLLTYGSIVSRNPMSSNWIGGKQRERLQSQRPKCKIQARFQLKNLKNRSAMKR